MRKQPKIQTSPLVEPVKGSGNGRLQRNRPRAVALEQRFMFDGAAAVDAVDAATRSVLDVAVGQAMQTRDVARATADVHSVPASLAVAQQQAQERIQQFLKQPDALEQLFQTLNGGQSVAPDSWLNSARTLASQLGDGEAGPQIELRSGNELQGARAAFAAHGTNGQPTIYLNADWLQGDGASTRGADAESVTRVLVEELGHFLDSTLNPGVDTAGDEGERFARMVIDAADPQQTAYLGGQGDHAVLMLDGQQIDVELAQFSFVNAYRMVYDLDNDNAIVGSRGETSAAKEQSTHNFNIVSLGAASVDDNTNSEQFSGNDVSAIGINIGGQRYFGWISRPIKSGGIVRGFYFWTDPQFVDLPTAQADGNQDGDSNESDNKGFLLVVDQTWFTQQVTAGSTAVTLNNTIDGNVGAVNYTTIGSSSDRVDNALNSLLPVNVAPVAVADVSNLSLAAGANGGPAQELGAVVATVNAVGNVLTNDTDSNSGDTKTVAKVGTSSANQLVNATTTSGNGTAVTGQYGTLTLGADGTYSYAVANTNSAVQALRQTSDTLSDVFTYTMKDSKGLTSTTTLTVKIVGANDAPVANPDSNTAKESTTVAGSGFLFTGYSATGNVLPNDTDVDAGDTKAIAGLTGAATIGSFTTTAPGSKLIFSGDNGFSANLTGRALYVSVSGTYSAVYDSAGAQITMSSKTETNPATNTWEVVLSGSPAKYYASGSDGSIVYTSISSMSTFFAANPSVGFESSTNTTENVSGMKTASVSATSSAGSSTVTPASSSLTGTVAIGMSVSGTGVPAGTKISSVNYDGSGNVTSVVFDNVITSSNGAVLTFSSSGGSTVTGRHGTLVLNSDGSYTYTPTTDNPLLSQGQSAVEQFNYTMQDAAGQTSSSTLYITVLGVGSTDPVANADAIIAVEAGGISNGTAGTNPTDNLLTNDTTPSGTKVVTLARSTSSATNMTVGTNTLVTGRYGVLTLSSTGAYTYTVSNSNSVVEALAASSDTLTDTFVYTVSNGSGLSSAALTVTIQGKNDAPVATDDTALALEAGGTANAIPGYNPSGNVLTNDTDVDDASSARVVSSIRTGAGEGVGTAGTVGSALSGLYGSITLNADGTWTYTVDNNNAAVNALAAGGTLTDAFNYTVTDRSNTGSDKLSDTAILAIAIQGAADTISVNNVFVNEASPYAVFTLSGAQGIPVSLALGNSTGLAATDAKATLTGSTADIGSLLQVYNGTSWVDYTTGTVTMPAGGQLLVRVAVNPDLPYEGNEAFTLTATASDGTTAIGIGTIGDEGAGDIYLSGNTTGTADTSGAGFPSALDDDRPLAVNSITVNEASPYAVFAVTGAVGQKAQLALGNTSSTTDIDALLNTDTGNAGATVPLQYFNGTAWVDYTPGSYVTLTTTQLLVRTAITQDTNNEGAETFTLVATNTGGTAGTGIATIKDDGTGTLFTASNPTGGVPATNTAGPFDDDRPLTIADITVNEASPYGVFVVSGAANQLATLALAVGTSTPATGSGTDYGAATGTGLQYWTGSTWANYTSGTVSLNANGKLLVRTPIVQDTLSDNNETFRLSASNTGGVAGTGTATIKDDGTGTLFTNGNPAGDTPPSNSAGPFDDDRPLTIGDITVNEGSPYGVFVVSGAANQLATLALAVGTTTPATGSGTDYGSATGTGLEYWTGSAWATYSSGTVPLNASGKLLVRTPIAADTLSDNNETFRLSATNTGGTAGTGTATIKDDGTGTLFTNGNPAGDTPPTDTTSVLDDDRPLTVNSVTVNEASPYAVFTVGGVTGQKVRLVLGNTSSTADKDASLGTDTGDAGTGVPLQYYNGAAWVDYTPNSYVTLPAATMLVRTAITQDTTYETAETFTLQASNTGGTGATGIATIKDDGTGDVFLPGNTSGTPNASTDPGYPTLDDDRGSMLVTGGTFNEKSPFAIFTVQAVTSPGGTPINLAVADVSANIEGAEYTPSAPEIRYSVDGGASWVVYNGTTNRPTLNAAGTFLVAVSIAREVDAASEGAETFKLTASYLANSAFDTSTIIDDGTGSLVQTSSGNPVAAGNVVTLDTVTAKDDDRPLTIGDITVNEASPYGVFVVSGAANQLATLTLAVGTSTPATGSGTDYGSATGTGLEYWTGTAWSPYTSGTVALNANGKLLVRTPIVQDTVSDNNETFRLSATNTGGTAGTGTATIKDDGTGTLFTNGSPTGDTPPSNPAGPFDDDRPLTIGDITVNEASPYGVFVVSGAANQVVTLALAAGASNPATPGGTDYGTASGTGLEIWTGTSWVPYAGGPVRLDASGKLLVRTPIVNDSTPDSNETFRLTATNTGGGTGSGTATIKDDGTGTIFTDRGLDDPAAPRDDDTPRPIIVRPPTITPAPPAPLPIVIPEPPAPLIPRPSFDSAVRPTQAAQLVPITQASIGEIYTSSSGFRTAVIDSPQPSLMLFKGVTDQFVEGNRPATFALPADTFAHTRADAVISVAARQTDGAALPGWIQFNAQSGTFSASPPPGFTGQIEIIVIARDNEGREAAATFKFNVGQGSAPRETPAGSSPPAPTQGGRSSLSDQLRAAWQPGRRGFSSLIVAIPSDEEAAAEAGGEVLSMPSPDELVSEAVVGVPSGLLARLIQSDGSHASAD